MNKPYMVATMENYRLVDKIGKGSYGKVYKAIKRNLFSGFEHFAIKQVACRAPENVELALQEFWALSRLPSNTNVIRFEECFLQHSGNIKRMQHGDTSTSSYLDLVESSLKGESSLKCSASQLWFSMEYCDGGDMNDYLLSRMPHAALNANFMEQLAKGVLFLHSNNVVHRDLKPENILIRLNSSERRNHGEYPTMKIADFGLAKVCVRKKDSDPDVNNTWFSSACGSDYFMAPEVFTGKYTAKADIFALGIIFWSVMDRITFIDMETKKLLLGAYIWKNRQVLPIGEAILNDTKLDMEKLLLRSSLSKPVVMLKSKCKKNVACGSCVSGNKQKLRQLIGLMIHPNPDKRPTSLELLKMLRTSLVTSINRRASTSELPATHNNHKEEAPQVPQIDKLFINRRKRNPLIPMCPLLGTPNSVKQGVKYHDNPALIKALPCLQPPVTPNNPQKKVTRGQRKRVVESFVRLQEHKNRLLKKAAVRLDREFPGLRTVFPTPLHSDDSDGGESPNSSSTAKDTTPLSSRNLPAKSKRNRSYSVSSLDNLPATPAVTRSQLAGMCTRSGKTLQSPAKRNLAYPLMAKDNIEFGTPQKLIPAAVKRLVGDESRCVGNKLLMAGNNVKHYDSLASFPQFIPQGHKGCEGRKRKLSCNGGNQQTPKRAKTSSVVTQLSSKLLTAVRRRIVTSLKTSPIAAVFSPLTPQTNPNSPSNNNGVNNRTRGVTARQ